METPLKIGRDFEATATYSNTIRQYHFILPPSCLFHIGGWWEIIPIDDFV